MSRRERAALLILLLCLLWEERAHMPLDINPANITVEVSTSSRSIDLSWRNPNTVVNQDCYESNVEYKSWNETWKCVFVRGFLFSLLSPDWRKSYSFRLRMRYRCCPSSWSAWSAEHLWRNESLYANGTRLPPEGGGNTGSAPVLLSAFVLVLLYCVLFQKMIRRWVFSRIPDPKHAFEELFAVDQCQSLAAMENPCMECMTADLVLVEEVEEQEEEREDGKMSSTDATESGWPVMDATGHSPF